MHAANAPKPDVRQPTTIRDAVAARRTPDQIQAHVREQLDLLDAERRAAQAAKERSGPAKRMAVVIALAAFFMLYYFSDVMQQIAAMPGIVVNVPADHALPRS
jgi:hypothetical protein